jgi:hypothetical protein
VDYQYLYKAAVAFVLALCLSEAYECLFEEEGFIVVFFFTT